MHVAPLRIDLVWPHAFFKEVLIVLAEVAEIRLDLVSLYVGVVFSHHCRPLHGRTQPHLLACLINIGVFGWCLRNAVHLIYLWRHQVSEPLNLVLCVKHYSVLAVCLALAECDILAINLRLCSACLLLSHLLLEEISACFHRGIGNLAEQRLLGVCKEGHLPVIHGVFSSVATLHVLHGRMFLIRLAHR